MAIIPIPSPGARLTRLRVSDFHFGNGSARDDVTRKMSDKLRAEIKLLAPIVVRDNTDTAMLGDVVDGWRYRSWQDCISAHRVDLINIGSLGLPRKPVRWVLGNHDAMVRDKDAAEIGPFVLCDKITDCGDLEEHGDRFNPGQAIWRSVGKAACSVLAVVGHFVSPKLEDRLYGLGGKIEGGGRYSKEHDRYQRSSLEDAAHRGLRGAVLGHTHRAVIDGNYVNTGSWANDGWSLFWSDGSVTRWRLP